MVERWLPIPGIPDYEVSDRGRVRSWKKFQGHPLPRVLRLLVNPQGYLNISFRVDGKGVTRRVHTVVAEAFLGPRPAGMEIRHLDGDRTNAVLENLAYGTHAENVYDSVKHGTHPQASKTHCPVGHAYDAENTYISPPGWRNCRTCRRACYWTKKRGAA